MSSVASMQLRTLEMESSLLGVLLTAETTREGAAAVLEVLYPAFDDLSAAIGLRDRDSLALHVLAERGPFQLWPSALEPQLAVGADPRVDARTGVFAVPLRAEGRVMGALLLGEPQRAMALLGDNELRSLLETAASAFVVLGDMLEFHRNSLAPDGILDMNMIAERLLRFRGYAIRERGIALDFVPTQTALAVRSDPRLEHALLRSLYWAESRSHGSVNRRIDVRVAEIGPSNVAVEITDSGPGDVPEISAGYFDLPLLGSENPALDRDRQDLGLIDRLLRACGGGLEVRGSKTDGTTLVLVVPRATVSKHASARSPSATS